MSALDESSLSRPTRRVLQYRGRTDCGLVAGADLETPFGFSHGKPGRPCVPGRSLVALLNIDTAFEVDLDIADRRHEVRFGFSQSLARVIGPGGTYCQFKWLETG